MQLETEESQRLLNMEEALHRRIVGQDEGDPGHLPLGAAGAGQA